MLLYIDPGTGSMLFSILIGVLGAGYYLLRTLFMKLKYSMSGGKKDKLNEDRMKYVIFSDSKRYWNIFKPICEEMDRRGQDIVYYTLSEDDPALSCGLEHIKAEYLDGGNKAFSRLNFVNAQIVLSTTPSLGVYQWKRSKDAEYSVHIAHMPNDITTYEMFGLDHYDAILLSGDYQIKQIRDLEKIRQLPAKECVLVGLPYMDEMARRLAETPVVPAHPRTVLLAPSWGKSGMLSRFGEKIIDPLIATGYDITVRPHPQSFASEKELMDRLMTKYPDSDHFHWNRDNDNFDVLNRSDILISDFSGVIFDYTLIFDKPILYADTSSFDKSTYDAAWLEEELWTFRMLPKLGEQLTEESLNDLAGLIERVIADPKYKQARDQAREETWAYRGEGAVRVCDYLMQKQEDLNPERKEEKK